MKRNLRKYSALVPLVLIFGLVCAIPAIAGPSGHLDWANRYTIAGWAWDDTEPEQAVEVMIDIIPKGAETAVRTFTVTAESYRGDLVSDTNDGNHGFFCPVDWTQFSGDSFTVTAYVLDDNERIPLTGTVTYQAAADGAALTAASAAKESAAEGDTTAGPLGPDSQTQTQAKDSKPSGASSGNSSPLGPKSASAAKTVSESAWKKGTSLGYFITTGYCNCSICSGGWGLTYSGTVPRANHTISADINVLPIGTKVMIDGIVYTVEDIGGGVNGDHIDIYYDSHEKAVAHGTKTVEVFSVISE